MIFIKINVAMKSVHRKRTKAWNNAEDPTYIQQWRKDNFSTNGGRTTGHMQNHECTHRSYILHKNQLKIDNRPK